MGITNPIHLAFIAIIALIVLGPKRLPDLARSLGEGMRHFRESLEGATQPEHDEVLTSAMAQPESPEAPVTAAGLPDTAASDLDSDVPPPAAAGEPATAPAPAHAPGPGDTPTAPPYPHAHPLAQPAPVQRAQAPTTSQPPTPASPSDPAGG